MNFFFIFFANFSEDLEWIFSRVILVIVAIVSLDLCRVDYFFSELEVNLNSHS